MFNIEKTSNVLSCLNNNFFSFTNKKYKKDLDKSYTRRVDQQKSFLLDKKNNEEFLKNFRHPLSRSIIVEQHLFNGYPRPKFKNIKQIIQYLLIITYRYIHPFFYAEKDWLKWSFNRYKLLLKDKSLYQNSLNHFGNPPYLKKGKFKWNLRHLRYLIIKDSFEKTIDKDLISQIKSVLDLGGCYGGYISLLAKDNPNRSYILVDLGENIPLAAYYLSQNHPLMKIKILNNENDKFVPEINSFTLIPAHLFRLIKDEKVDLLCNFVSLAEMSRLHFEEYINSNIYKNSKILHLVNRFVSSPIFSRGSNPHTWLKSTQNLTNYKLENRENKFFDVFPLYHFQPMAEDKNNNPREYKFTTLASFFWDWKRSPITSQYFHSITVLKK